MGMLTGLQQFFGTGMEQLTTAQMVARALAAYGVGLLLVRAFTTLRLLGRYGAFDFVLSIILGSTLSRSINGSAHFLESLVAVQALMMVHTLLAAVSVRSGILAGLIKGHASPLVEDGQVQRERLRQAGMTERDLDEAIRLKTPVSDPKRLDRLLMERNGGIGVVLRPSEAKVVEISVRDGVQTVRIELL